MNKSREQFERLAAKEGLSLEVFNGDYNWMNTRLAWKFWQGCKQEIDMTIEQLQEENKNLRQAIIDIHSNCEECEYQGYGTFYAVEQDYVNYAYELTQPKD